MFVEITARVDRPVLGVTARNRWRSCGSHVRTLGGRLIPGLKLMGVRQALRATSVEFRTADFILSVLAFIKLLISSSTLFCICLQSHQCKMLIVLFVTRHQ